MARTPHLRHVRHGRFKRVRHTQRLEDWLGTQATRLTTTLAAVYNALKRLPADEIETALANIDLPANTVLPAITGTAQVGQTLTCGNGTWTGVPTVAYKFQWKKAGVAIAGATANTYVPKTVDIGSTITCTVTGYNTGGDVSVNTAATAAVIA